MRPRSIILVLVLGVILGAAVGGYSAWWYTSRTGNLDEIIALGWVAQRSFYLYTDGEEAQAREALLFFLEVLEEARQTRGNSPDGILDNDTAFTYARLVTLEKASGNTELAQEYLQKGVVYFEQAGAHDPSPEKLMSVVTSLDTSHSK